ncbi:MAG: glycosyltransferase family 4 protein [Armatimonadota bacterium]|jgi:glycosyltransferase involved in cell wall biosynthesis
MRILLMSANFPPEIGTAAHLFYELAGGLRKRGHEVTAVTGFPSYNVAPEIAARYRGLHRRERMDGVSVVRTRVPRFVRASMIGRGLEHLCMAWPFAAAALAAGRHDVTLVYSPPLTLGVAAWLIRWLRRTPFVFNVQDLFPKEAVDIGVLRSRPIIRALELLETFIYRRARFVTAHSAGNREHVIGRGCPAERAAVVPNWVDTDRVKPMPRDNEFSRRHRLNGRFVVSFAGTMGLLQDMETIVGCASLLKDHDGIQFLLVGDGVEKPKAEQQIAARGLRNVIMLPMQPRDVYPQILAASDASLVTLKTALATPAVPSKILSIMAAQRPVISSIRDESDATKLVKGANCGICARPEDPGSMAAAVLRLHEDRELQRRLGQNGRQYAEAHLSLRAALDRYEALFRRAADSTA